MSPTRTSPPLLNSISDCSEAGLAADPLSRSLPVPSRQRSSSDSARRRFCSMLSSQSDRVSERSTQLAAATICSMKVRKETFSVS